MKCSRAAIVLLGACGGGGSSSPDASTPPAIDAAVDAAPSGRVDITVLTRIGDGQPDPLAIAIFYDDTDAIVASGMVDAHGEAHADLPNGGSVRVLRVDPSQAGTVHLVTIRGAKNGDHLAFGMPRDPLNTTGTWDDMIVSYPPESGTQLPAFLRPCGTQGANPLSTGHVELGFYNDCVTPTFDMLVVSSSNDKSIWAPGNTYSPGNTITVPNTPWQPFGTFTASYTNIPTGMTQLGFEVIDHIGQLAYSRDSRQLIVTPPTATSSSVGWPVGGSSAQLRVFAPVNLPQDVWSVVEIGNPNALTVDLAAQPLPSVSSQTQSGTGVTWVETGSGATADARYVDWSASWSDNGAPRYVDERIVEDPTGPTSVTLLPLPADYAAYDARLVQPLLLQFHGTHVGYVDYDNLNGYDEARPYGERISAAEVNFVEVTRRAHTRYR